jgi:hypothetical protein
VEHLPLKKEATKPPTKNHRTITVTQCGRICVGRRKINSSQVFAGQNVGIKEVAEKIWLVSRGEAVCCVPAG